MSGENRLDVKAVIEQRNIPTYLPKDPIKLPIFFEKRQYQGASGRIYPIPVQDSFSNEKTEQPFKVGILENEYIYVEILPEIGGKIKRAYDKKRGYDFMYHNSVIKPAGIGIAGAWISGGVEFNWPQHHRPTTFMPVEAFIEASADGEKTIWVGELEPMYKMKGMAGITVSPGRSCVKAKCRIYNGTPFAQPFMWWANLAAPATESYRIVFPPDVEYVVDHDRKAVMSWPVASGVYGTGKAFDFGESTDLSRNSAITPQGSFMVPMGHSKYDFISGYDEALGCGIVSVSDHNIAPAKKLFTWGIGEHSSMWRMNLTDDDGPYIEIMTGAYTDNQPDFSWIQPYETKEFEQYWYPISNIGLVKNATVDAALNVEEREGGLFLGVAASGVFEGALLELYSKGELLFNDRADLAPDTPYTRLIETVGPYDKDSLEAVVRDKAGSTLVSYRKNKRGAKKRPSARLPAKKPRDIESLEELYINGLHLIQYRHATFVPEHYFAEALRRDPGDSRCNLEMGKLMVSRGMFREALVYFDRAVERLTLRNETPCDAEVYYQRGLALRYLGETDAAYDSIYKSVWQYAFRSAGYFILAEIDACRGDFERALYEARLSLETNAKNNKAKALISAILRRTGRQEEAVRLMKELAREDPLDLNCRSELYLADPEDKDASVALAEAINDKPDYCIDLAIGYMAAGFCDDAIETLSFTAQNPLTLYYLGFCFGQAGDAKQAEAYYLKADAADHSYCFPSRLEDIAVLKDAVRKMPNGAMAPYYLGCLFYDKQRYDDAILCFEHSKLCDESFSHVWRNLAIAYFDKKKSLFDAKMHMEKALSLDSDPRIFYEYQQLLKNMGETPERRLSIYSQYPESGDARDDSYIEKMTLTGMQGDYRQAIELAANRQFHVYEGGEGKLSRLHNWLHILEGNRLYKAGDVKEALEYYNRALIIPLNYSEARYILNEESHVFFHIGMARESEGDFNEATAAYYTAAADKGYVSELSIWRAFALMKIGRGGDAQKVLRQMVEEGEALIKNKDSHPYFGGGPAPQPFENDIAKKNTASGLILKAYGYLGLGQYKESRQAAGALEKIDPYNFSLYVLNQISDDVR